MNRVGALAAASVAVALLAGTCLFDYELDLARLTRCGGQAAACDLLQNQSALKCELLPGVSFVYLP